MEYRFINHDSCAGESLERVMDDKDVTWDDAFRGDACPSRFARRLERQRDELTDRWERSANAFLIEQGKREAAERQRDGLLEALEMVETYLVERGIESRGTTGRTLVLPRIRAAIASVKGGRDE
jgi:hypothetical protein